MPMINVIVKHSFNPFRPTFDFLQHIKACGHKHIYTMEARTDERLISYIREHGTDGYLYGENPVDYGNPGSVSIKEVDTSKPWILSGYDGSEGIEYLKVKDSQLNLYEIDRS